MRVGLDEKQLEDLKVIINKLIQSFNNFCKSTEDLARSIDKLTKKIDKE